MTQVKIIVERHADGFVAYPLGVDVYLDEALSP
jgi:hypothetical protein